MPISGGVMCQSGTRIGRTKAIDSALKASKKVALPITIRATTNQRDVGTCSIRAIRPADACSVSKAGEDETSGASDLDVALTTDKASSALYFQVASSGPLFRNPSDISRPRDQLQNFFGNYSRALDRRQMADIRQHRKRGPWHGSLDLLRHRDRRGVILLADDDTHRHPHRRLIVPEIRVAKHFASRAIAIDIVGKEYVYMGADDVRVRFAKGIADPAGGLKRR